MKYRGDIDGLRAIAVLGVMAFHLGVARIPGGFVGVDVFFVVSGYLITGLLAADLENSSFSLARFYERRIRRIAPVLVVVLAATTTAAAAVLYPAPFRDYGDSLLAATLSASNFYFWLNSNYFAPSAAELPLLHTWSLAVEEQFYLVFPLMLAALHKLPRRGMLLVLAALAAASFAASAIQARTDSAAAFYLPHSRAWELGLGALLALKAAPRLKAPRLASPLGLLGLALIAASMLKLNAATPFPGAAALAPCLGAALVIYAGECGGLIARLLSWRPLAFVGLISYSLYLWHWPLIALTRIATGAEDLTHVQQAAIAGLSLVLATLSWRYVEQPFRRTHMLRPALFRRAGVAAAGLAAGAAAVIVTGGAPQRYSQEVVRLASFLEYPVQDSLRVGTCFIDSHYSAADFDEDRCLSVHPGRSQILLMGDSHAAHLWQALSQEARDVDVLQATASGCAPTVLQRPHSAQRCAQIMQHMFDAFLPQHSNALLMLSAEWTRDDAPRLARTFEWARGQGIQVVLLGPSAEYDRPLPILLADARRLGDPDLPNRHVRVETARIDRQLASLAAAYGVRYISLHGLMCPQDRCRSLAPGGAPMQFDEDHFTPQGATYVAGYMGRAGVLSGGAAYQSPRPSARPARRG